MTSKTPSMRRRFLIGFLCVLAVLLANPLSAQESKKFGKLYLKEYQAKNADESAIITRLLLLESSFNSHDLKEFTSQFTKDALYRPCGSSTNPVASKGCQETITYNFGSFKYEKYYDPEITVEGDKATIKMALHTGGYLADYTAWMQKVGGVWLIKKNDYAHEHWVGD